MDIRLWYMAALLVPGHFSGLIRIYSFWSLHSPVPFLITFFFFFLVWSAFSGAAISYQIGSGLGWLLSTHVFLSFFLRFFFSFTAHLAYDSRPVTDTLSFQDEGKSQDGSINETTVTFCATLCLFSPRGFRFLLAGMYLMLARVMNVQQDSGQWVDCGIDILG